MESHPYEKFNMKRLAPLLFALIAGCAAMNAPPPGVRDQPQPYIDGYTGGCNSGYVAAGHPYYRFTKDANRFDSDRLYRQGWQDGFATCKGKYDSLGR